MKQFLIFALLLLACVIGFYQCVHAQTQTRACLIQRVTDGDTITCQWRRRKLRVRLLSIDAPEMSQPYGNAARLRLTQLIGNSFVSLTFDPYKVDHYGRILGRISLGTLDVNKEMVKSGLAWHLAPSGSGSDATLETQFQTLQTAAQAAHVGIWQDPAPVQPSVWRATHH